MSRHAGRQKERHDIQGLVPEEITYGSLGESCRKAQQQRVWALEAALLEAAGSRHCDDVLDPLERALRRLELQHPETLSGLRLRLV